MEDETRARSPLTPDERAEEQTIYLRVVIPVGVDVDTVLGSMDDVPAEVHGPVGLADKLEAEPEPDPRLQERVADMLTENDAAGPGPVSRREYLDDAAAILRLVGETPTISAETVICCDEAKVASPGCDHGHGLETLGELIDAYSNPRSVERERDEAREALRELLAALAADRRKILSQPGPRMSGCGILNMPRTKAAVVVAEAIVEGVERTHTLVPNRALEIIEDRLEDYVGDQLGDGASGLTVQTSMAALNAVSAALRGENPEWPS